MKPDQSWQLYPHSQQAGEDSPIDISIHNGNRIGFVCKDIDSQSAWRVEAKTIERLRQ
jgi:hypothetical protein